MKIYSFDLKSNLSDKTFDIYVNIEDKTEDISISETPDVKREKVVKTRTIIKNKKEKENGIYQNYEGVEYLRVHGMTHVFQPKTLMHIGEWNEKMSSIDFTLKGEEYHNTHKTKI